MISIEQIRAARGLLGWTQDELAVAANLSTPSINTLERRIANPKVETLAAIQKALEEAGIEFTEGEGVKFRASGIKTRVFEGTDSVIRLLNDIYDTLVGTDKELMIAGVEEKQYTDIGGQRIVELIHKRVKQGVKTKILTCEGDMHFNNPVEDYRWMKKEAFPTTTWYVYDNKYAHLLWGPPPKVVLIENAEIAESFRKQFLAHWAASKPPSKHKK